MSANADLLNRSDLIDTLPPEMESPRIEPCGANKWNLNDFASEQIRGLVRRVFFGHGASQVKQVVFSAADRHIDIAAICEQVGRTLAAETRADVAIVCRERQGARMPLQVPPRDKSEVKSRSTQTEINLWRVPEFEARESGEEAGTARYWLSCLAELRNEFDYAVIHGPAAGISGEAALLGRMADGIVLVLAAHSTRRAAARKIKETLVAAESRILGTVLSDRTFPIPERIYRRL